MSNDFKVLVVELQSSDGTRYALNGMEVDESPLRFNDGEERTIGSLKEKINSVFFRAEPRPLGFIKVYSYPSAAAAPRSRGRLIPNGMKLFAKVDSMALWTFIISDRLS